MPRTTITAQDASSASFPWSTAGLTLTMTAADVTNKQRTPACQRLLLIARNTGGSSRTVIITSSADPRTGRTGDATATLAAGAIWMHVIPRMGWQHSDSGTLYFYYEASHSDIAFAAVQLEE